MAQSGGATPPPAPLTEQQKEDAVLLIKKFMPDHEQLAALERFPPEVSSHLDFGPPCPYCL